MIINKNGKQFRLLLATPGDYSSILEFVGERLKEYDQLFDKEGSENDLMDIEKTYFSNGGYFFLLKDDSSHLIGTLGLLKLNTSIGKLRKMYIHPDYRSIGLGKLLLDHALKTAKEQSLTEIILETMTEMKSAIHLYQAFGFQKIEGKIYSSRCNILMHKNL